VRPQPLAANIRLWWKGLAMANTLAYFDLAKSTTVRKLYSTGSFSDFRAEFDHKYIFDSIKNSLA
jgi:hypothetical protein